MISNFIDGISLHDWTELFKDVWVLTLVAEVVEDGPQFDFLALVYVSLVQLLKIGWQKEIIFFLFHFVEFHLFSLLEY